MQKVISFLISSVFLFACFYYIFPYNYKHCLEPMIINRIANRNIKFNAEDYVLNSIYYLHNSFLFNKYLLTKPSNKPQLADIHTIGEMSATKSKLLNLFKKYPNLTPAVFVWEYSSSKSTEINADDVYPSASIIKIPIAFELMRLIDYSSKTRKPIKLSDEREFSELFRTSGSGILKKTPANVYYSIDYLAKIMISESDNSATNMILYEIGGMLGFNRAMRNMGLKVTSMGAWLPDLEGYNKITAKEISTILYNIDNPRYINPKHKRILRDYLLSTKNTHLLKEKLPQNAMILHKTGDIGTMLGDSGIVYTDNGKKYIVTILVKRPYNDYSAKTLIQEASLIIYNDIKGLF